MNIKLTSTGYHIFTMGHLNRVGGNMDYEKSRKNSLSNEEQEFIHTMKAKKMNHQHKRESMRHLPSLLLGSLCAGGQLTVTVVKFSFLCQPFYYTIVSRLYG